MPMDPFQAFAIQRRADFRRIASQTDGEYTAGDVENEAWLIAERIGAKRRAPINFSLRADQELVLAWLHNELIRYADKQLRYAVKLDKGWDDDGGDAPVTTLAHQLAAPDNADPAVLLLHREEVSAPLALVQESYSQASAYVILLDRFHWDTADLAAHLRVVVQTLLTRMRFYIAWIRWQQGLFDGVQTVALDFEPSRARLLAPRGGGLMEEVLHQSSWPFGSDEPFSTVR